MQSGVISPAGLFTRKVSGCLTAGGFDGASRINSVTTRSVRKLYSSAPQTHATAVNNTAGKSFSNRMLSTLSVLGGLFTRQANIYVHNRVRKALQLHAVYRSAFGQQFFRAFVHNLLRTAIRKRTPMFLLGAAGFSFQDEGISDDEIASCIDEFEILKKRPPSTPCCTHSAKCDRRTGHALKLNMEKFRTHLRSEGFEPVVESDRLHIWRKSETGKANYTYKVYGTFTDVPARAFFAVQCDTDYRKKWDKLVVQLDVVESDPQNDVVYWHMYYPFPLSSRDYVFVRRSVVDTERACMVVVCHATQHPQCPPRKGVVRVNEYMSNMVISPHNSFDENGFDYLLTYYDDPQSSFPSPVYAWMAASGVHDYVDKLHKATQQFNDGSALRPTLSITKGTISSSASAISNNTSVHFQTTHQQAQTHYAWHRSAL